MTSSAIVREPAGRAKGSPVATEEQFLRILDFEQKRSDRSRRPFLLMLASAGDSASPARRTLLERLIEILRGEVRETDHVGWRHTGTTLGVIFTEIEQANSQARAESIAARIRHRLQRSMTPDDYGSLSFSFHLYPEHWGDNGGDPAAQSALYPGPPLRKPPGSGELLLKRWMDIAGGTAAIVLTLPLMAIIAILIKATSPGPVLFRQQRVGQFGRRFTFLKFRSMRQASDPGIHRAYVEQLIAGGAEQPARVYKITNDARVTPVGRFLRKTSLDELPQLFNVLAGDMSLVGPRPPIPYEVDCYQAWHRRRLLDVKPGITGLWQVSGRSKVGFDDMVRMDLQYARKWSLWLDLKILLKTPRVVVFGDGAY